VDSTSPLQEITCYTGSHRVTSQPAAVDFPAFTPGEAGTRFSDPGGMQGWVDLDIQHINIMLNKYILTILAKCMLGQCQFFTERCIRHGNSVRQSHAIQIQYIYQKLHIHTIMQQHSVNIWLAGGLTSINTLQVISGIIKPVSRRDQAWIPPEPLHHVTIIQL